MLHPSPEDSVYIPTDQPLWSWLFESPLSILSRAKDVKGFRDAESGEFVSYADAKTCSTYLSTSFWRDYEVREGDRILIFSNNSVWYPIVMFAGFRIGAVVSGASPGYTVQEVTNALRIASPKVIVVDHESFRSVIRAATGLGIPKDSIVFSDITKPGFMSISSLISTGRSLGELQTPKWTMKRGQTTANTCALLCFSSGTTGMPKAVMISHGNVISQCCQMKRLRKRDDLGVLLSPLPLFHITGLVQIMNLPAHINQEVILMKKFNMKTMLDAIVKYQSTELWLVPPIIIRMVNDPLVGQYNLHHVTQFNTGAAPLSPEIIQKLAKKFPTAGIKQGWGMTESTSCITSTPPKFLSPRFAHTVGTAVPNTVLKIVDVETGKELGINSPGEILAKGPQISMGYLNNDYATRETYGDDGFLHTGDLGSIDEIGLVTIQDRIKELIKVRGTGVAPAELEDILLGHPSVQDVAVIGVKDEYAGELPRAFVVLHNGVSQDAETAVALQAFVKTACTRAKWLDGGVEFVDAIPKSASGKILRRVLRDKAAEAKQPKVRSDDSRL